MFKDLPDEALIRLKDLLPILPWGRSTHHNKVKNGTFPAPIKISERIKAWNVGVIRQHLKEVASVNQVSAPQSVGGV